MLMFVYTLIIMFLSLFLVVTNSGMSFLTPFSFFFFLIYLIHNIISSFANIIYFLFDNTVHIPCDTVADCPPTILPVFYECIDKFCMLHIE